MKHTFTILSLAAAVLMGSQTALAKGDGEGRPDRSQMREKMLERFDADGDGKLNEEERAEARKARQEMSGREGKGPRGAARGQGQGRARGAGRGGQQGRGMDPGRMLDRFDADGNGQLNRQELGQLLRSMPGARGAQGARGARGRIGDSPRFRPAMNVESDEDAEASPPRRGRRGRLEGDRGPEGDREPGPRGTRGRDFRPDRFRPEFNRDGDEDGPPPRGRRGPRDGDRAERGPGRDRGDGPPMGRPDPGRMFDRLDADEDGVLSREEFMKMGEMMRGPRGRGGPPEFGPRPDREGGESESDRPARSRRGRRPRPDFSNVEPEMPQEEAADGDTV